MSIEKASPRIRRTAQIDDGLVEACLEILRDLPDYFDEDDSEEGDEEEESDPFREPEEEF